jgi:chondroitin-sulfate-ABC endolyase/exolyase
MPLICNAKATMPAYTPELFSFEKGLSKNFSGKGLSVSQTRSIIGKNSLQWDWTKKSQEFTFSHDFIRYTKAEMKALGSIGQTQVLYFWVYNENPADGEMTVFLGDKTSYDSSFKVNINFKGWRLVHVALDQHMNLHIPGASNAATHDLKRIKFQAPDNVDSGRLHIDPIMITAYNAALLKRDYQVRLPRVDRVPIEPYLKPGEFYPAPTAEDLEAMARFRAEIIRGAAHAPRGISIEAARLKMLQLEIEEVNGVIKGRHLSEYYHIDAFYPDQLSPDDKKDFDRIVLLDRGRYGLTSRFTKFYVRVAKAWYVQQDPAIKAELADIAVLLSRYILDQGFAEGSSLM